MAKRIKINLEVKDKGTKQVKKFTDNTERSFKDLKRATTKVNTGFDKTIKKLKLMTVAAVAFGAAAAIAFGKSAIDAASNLQEVVGKFEVVFRDQIGVAEEYAKVLVDSYGVSERAAKQYLSSIQDLLKPMGMISDAAADMSNEVVKLSIDLGSFNNMPTERVMMDMQSALVGNFETMKKYGIILNETVVKQEAYNLGLVQAGDDLTASMKAQAAYSLMVKGSSDAIGDWARTSKNYANQLKQLHSNVETFYVLLGDNLLPTVNDMVTAFNDWAKGTGNLSDAVELLIGGLKTLTITLVALAAIQILVWTSKFIGWLALLAIQLGVAAGAAIALGSALQGALAGVVIGTFLNQLKFMKIAVVAWADIIGKIFIKIKFRMKDVLHPWTRDDIAGLKRALDEHAAIIKGWREEVEKIGMPRIAPPKILGKPKPSPDKPPAIPTPDDELSTKFDMKAKTMTEVGLWEIENRKKRDKVLEGLNKKRLEEEMEARDKELKEYKELGEEMQRDFEERAQAKAKVLRDQAQEAKELTRKTQEQWREVADVMIDTVSAGFTDIIVGAKNAKEAFADMAKSMARYLIELGIRMMIVRTLMSAFGVGMADGGITPTQAPATSGVSYAAGGGVFSGPSSGYPAILHGNEAVIPLKGGKVPVDLGGGGRTINIITNVENQARATPAENEDLANKISKGLKEQMKMVLRDEQRAGGMLSRGMQRGAI